jgi:hypothetical protein
MSPKLGFASVFLGFSSIFPWLSKPSKIPTTPFTTPFGTPSRVGSAIKGKEKRHPVWGRVASFTSAFSEDATNEDDQFYTRYTSR